MKTASLSAPRRLRQDRPSKRVELGQYIVADPQICHGKPTFKGTRIMVWQLFEHLALGEPLEEFPKHFPGRITLEAAREALELGRQFFAESPEAFRRWAALSSGER